MNEAIEKRLADRGIQPTAMRQLVLEYLSAQENALSLTDLERGMAHTDRTTLYRTLKTFESKGLIHGIDDGTGAVKYGVCEDTCEPVRHRDLHLHFHCLECGETTCLPAIAIPEPDLPDGYIVHELNLIAKGICPPCTTK
jgi:Fur family ferric uptake transcriptional regulator